ncbi:protein-L-isoaspartate O-methyltransferase [candidate division KSB3 bacterium]|uniref:Protein-L-isoaspartate O-methyltransferase n=1 Tax=candidate division KSB3 bacterium TaxID=2044937 RepID=A0A2G6KFP3_9BACT|nr:MAG: protein-L-isoaspartate O-methyltransferase [candidate division KSB3 bacterium]
MSFDEETERMIEQQLIPRGIHAPRVLAAMRTVPRHLFVGHAFSSSAYGDHPLPIGEEQTISQPYMVALMTELLDVPEKSTVLEIGTGSGYQTAILAEVAEQVHTVERFDSLAEHARDVLERLQYTNIKFHVGDGTLGWNECAPYERILVTAGAPVVPESLIAQLADEGKLVIPVGDRMVQTLQIITKHGNRLETKTSCQCIFVKLIGQDGWGA